jgi:cell division protein FtsB
MRSVSQLLRELELLRQQNEELREEIARLRANQPQYFSADGIDDRWWFRKNVEAKP